MLKALARDLPDRYQSAKEFYDALSAFIAQYKFNPAEMQEFVRGLFRADYQKECEELEACQNASIEDEPELVVESSPSFETELSDIAPVAA